MDTPNLTLTDEEDWEAEAVANAKIHACYEKLQFLCTPKELSVLYITPHYCLSHETPKPNWFHRKMHKLFFGFEWKDGRDVEAKK